MAKVVKKKKKLKLKNFLILILILGVLGFSVYFLMDVPTKNILIKNTSYINDDYILEKADIKDYPPFLFLSKSKIKKTLEKDNYILSCEVHKSFFNVLTINVKEEKPLFYDSNKNVYVFASGKTIKEDNINKYFRIPRLINYVPEKKYKKLITSMNKVNEDVLGKMSDIEYVPNDYDKDRFYIYMDDGNAMFLTLTKFKQANYYSVVVEQLEGRKGILYLDSGNHFEIKQ